MLAGIDGDYFARWLHAGISNGLAGHGLILLDICKSGDKV